MGHYAKRFFGQQSGGEFIKGNKLSLDAGNPLSYPESGTTWFDLSGAGNNGTLVNGVAFSTANGGVMSFDGVNDYVNMGNKFGFTSEPFSISLWIKPNSLAGAGGAQGGILFWKGNYKNSGFYCQIDISNGSLYLTTNQTGGSQYTVSNPNSIYVNVWANIVIVRSGSSVRIYSNGVDVTATAATHINPTANANNFTIGAYGTEYNYNGLVNNFDIHDYALTPEQIAANFNANRNKYGIL